jgi:hypothetical protein
MTAALAVFAAAWPIAFILVAVCNVDWNKRGGL